jgi:hypothetical protein
VLHIPKTDKVIKAIKDKDRDIKITLNNNVILNRTIKVVLLPKFLSKPNKLKEYLNKIQIYITYNLRKRLTTSPGNLLLKLKSIE